MARALRRLSLLGVLSLLLVACGGTALPTRTAAPPTIPPYPNVRSGTLQEDSSPKARSVTFLTGDERKAVHGFYATEMMRAGWAIKSSGTDLRYTLMVDKRGCPVYTFEVRTERPDEQTLAVTVVSSWEICGGY